MIRAALSTLGCGGIPLGDVAQLAVNSGFDGVELRAAGDEPVHVGLSAAQRNNAARQLADAGIFPLTIASYVRIAADDLPDEEVVAETVAYVELAADIGAQYVRVFPGGLAADEEVAARLVAIAGQTAGSGVTVAIETHDSHPTVVEAVALLSRTPQVALIWDVLHPWRMGESVADSVAAAIPHLGYVQVKDVASREDLTPLPPGHGVVPLDEIATGLVGSGYNGWVSWEYERKWFPSVPSVATVGADVARWITSAFSS